MGDFCIGPILHSCLGPWSSAQKTSQTENRTEPLAPLEPNRTFSHGSVRFGLSDLKYLYYIQRSMVVISCNSEDHQSKSDR
ncbi:hypothetical protein KSP40_PGU004166 [Platanthera guangdongensis]|uniref:Uncharacterized protein n=1 Tax=Platanthera guangdongensis TaxID=2320717 RepID=A0ABR2MWG9_9ASPA